MQAALRGPVRKLWLLAVLGLASLGCQDREGIRVLTESRPTRRLPAPLSAEQQKYRTLAAMIPVDSIDNETVGWWFLKYSGPYDSVTKHRQEFDRFLESVKVTAEPDEPVKWKVPEGWVEVMDIPRRYGTLRFPDRSGSDEIAITQFGGSVLENVNRWRTQVGLEPVLPSALDSVTTLRNINGKLVIVVDFSGPKEPKAPMALPGMMPAGHP